MKYSKCFKVLKLLSISFFILFSFLLSYFSFVHESKPPIIEENIVNHKAETLNTQTVLLDSSVTKASGYVAPKIIQDYETHFLDEKFGTHCLVKVCEEDNNLITDCSFENGTGNWNQNTLFASNYMSVISTDKAKSGNKCLKFNTKNTKENVWCIFYLDVEPNTVYYFTGFSRGDFWSDTNKCDMSFGIIDAATGKFVESSYSGYHCADYQLGTTFDEQWHISRAEVNTGSATKIGIGFTANSSVAYFDELYFFKSEDAVEYQFPKRDVEFPIITDENPEFIGCNKDFNLVDDFDFEEDGNSYWKDSLGYDITATVKDTSSVNGKALYYLENTYGSSKPKQTYYIKWIDVEPDTEYTFSASYKVLKSGNGWFGVINGSEYLPAAIKKFKFSELLQSDDPTLWNTTGVTFNSGGFSRVGIAVCDIGGEAFIDNLRLFKKNYGIVLESNPNVQSFGFEYDYTDKSVSTQTDARELIMGNAYLRYESNLGNVTIENEGDNNYLKIVKTKDLPSYPIRTTIQLEPNSYYRISYKYKLKTTKNNSTGNWVNKPIFTACLGDNVWYNWLVKLDETRPCQISGNKLATDGFSYTDTRGLVGMHLDSTEEWATYSEIVYTSSIVGGADKNQKYLGMFFTVGDTFEYICLDDFVAEKISESSISADTFTLNYDGTDGADTYRNLLSMNKIDTQNGYLHITDDGQYYNFNAMNFGYKFKPDSEYEIEMRYKVNKCNIKATQIFGLYEKENFYGSSHTIFTGDQPIYAFEKKVMSDFKTVKFNFKTSKADGIDKWLTFAGETEVGLDMYIDYIKISRIPDYNELVSVFDFEIGQDMDYSDGTTDYTYEKDGYGNRYLRIFSDDKTDEYPYFVFRTNIELKPDTDYTVSFQYKTTEHYFDRAFFLAGSKDNNWQFRYKPYWTGEATAINRTNLIGNEFTDSTGYKYRTGKLPITTANDWTRAEVSFNTGEIADSIFKYLSFLVQLAPTGRDVREICIDDIVVTEHHNRAKSGYVIVNKGYGNKLTFNQISNIEALSSENGYLFNGWFKNKSFTESFNSEETTDLPYMIYADYTLDFNKDNISNILDLVKLKKISSGLVTEYVPAADVNGDSDINALDLTNFKNYLLLK